MKVPLAEKHTGMKISMQGLLGRIARGERQDNGQRYCVKELLKHLEQLGKEYYSGNISFVDEFLQCYSLDSERPTETKKSTTVTELGMELESKCNAIRKDSPIAEMFTLPLASCDFDTNDIILRATPEIMARGIHAGAVIVDLSDILGKKKKEN